MTNLKTPDSAVIDAVDYHQDVGFLNALNALDVLGAAVHLREIVGEIATAVNRFDRPYAKTLVGPKEVADTGYE